MRKFADMMWKLFGKWFVGYMLDNMSEVERELRDLWKVDGVPSDPKVILNDLKAALAKAFMTF